MTKTFLSLLMVASIAVPLQAQTAPAKLIFPGHRFSIAPLEEISATSSYVVLFMNLPPTENFSPNVNVMVQQYQGTLEDFKILSETQFVEQKWVLIRSEVREGKALVLEYAGAYNGVDMHWYSRVLKRGGQVFLVTCTARESQWGKLSPRLVGAVDSFTLEK